MGKVYVDTVKYIIYAEMYIDGVVEKPDIVGAIFGQTEGLLGENLDLRELQKSGRIGRIDVKTNIHDGKTDAKIDVPSSLDRVETAILGAALETVDRVGPCEARISISKIEDTRTAKRKFVIERAKHLLSGLTTNVIPESQELAEEVRNRSKIAGIITFGPDKLPAGPEITNSSSIIVVEGRADVLVLLKCDLKNVVAVDGTNISKSIADLTKNKQTTAFVDGDRGGDIILKELRSVGKIDFVAKAPDGKEVEELTNKEILLCLRRKILAKDYFKFLDKKTFNTRPKLSEQFDSRSSSYYNDRRNQPSRQKHDYVGDYGHGKAIEFNQENRFSDKNNKTIKNKIVNKKSSKKEQRKPVNSLNKSKQVKKINNSKKNVEIFKKIMNEIEGTLTAKLLDAKFKPFEDMTVRELLENLREKEKVNAVVFDGIVTQRLVDIASEKNISFLVGMKYGKIKKKPDSLQVISINSKGVSYAEV